MIMSEFTAEHGKKFDEMEYLQVQSFSSALEKADGELMEGQVLPLISDLELYVRMIIRNHHVISNYSKLIFLELIKQTLAGGDVSDLIFRLQQLTKTYLWLNRTEEDVKSHFEVEKLEDSPQQQKRNQKNDLIHSYVQYSRLVMNDDGLSNAEKIRVDRQLGTALGRILSEMYVDAGERRSAIFYTISYLKQFGTSTSINYPALKQMLLALEKKLRNQDSFDLNVASWDWNTVPKERLAYLTTFLVIMKNQTQFQESDFQEYESLFKYGAQLLPTLLQLHPIVKQNYLNWSIGFKKDFNKLPLEMREQEIAFRVYQSEVQAQFVFELAYQRASTLLNLSNDQLKQGHFNYQTFVNQRPCDDELCARLLLETLSGNAEHLFSLAQLRQAMKVNHIDREDAEQYREFLQEGEFFSFTNSQEEEEPIYVYNEDSKALEDFNFQLDLKLSEENKQRLRGYMAGLESNLSEFNNQQKEEFLYFYQLYCLSQEPREYSYNLEEFWLERYFVSGEIQLDFQNDYCEYDQEKFEAVFGLAGQEGSGFGLNLYFDVFVVFRSIKMYDEKEQKAILANEIILEDVQLGRKELNRKRSFSLERKNSYDRKKNSPKKFHNPDLGSSKEPSDQEQEEESP
jgi:hypothetical protein